MRAALTGLLCVAAACGPAPSTPTTPNRPPRIVLQQVQPASGFVNAGTAPGCELSFSAMVADPDVGDLIHWAFFIDPQVSDKKAIDGLIPQSGQELRAGRAEAVFRSEDASTTLFTPGTHRVELFLADADFGNNRVLAPHATLPDGGVDPSYEDTYSWTVETAAGPCP